MRIQLLAVAIALGSVVPAFAADAVVEDVVVVDSPYNWSGVYIGAQAGYGWGDGRASDTGGNYTDPDPDGFLGGAYVGYNYQFSNNIVLGGELDFAYADIDGNAGVFSAGIPQGAGFSQKLKWSGAARARLGYAVDRFLPYIAGGVAFGEINGWNDGAPDDEFSDTYTGWTIGVGTDYAFTDNLIGRVEYRYTDFGNQSFDGGGVDMDLNTNDIRLGIAYKF